MKILLVSDSFLASSGYANQGELLAKAMLKAGHEVFYYGLSYTGRPLIYDGIMLFGTSEYHPAFDMISFYADMFDVDLILTLKDPYAFHHEHTKRFTRPWLAVAPIDTEPVGVITLGALQNAFGVIALTKFSQQQLAEKGVNSVYAPHGYNEDIFNIGPSAFRNLHNIPQDKFLVSVIAANQSTPSRKNLDKILSAWRKFVDLEPNSMLYLHTNPTPTQGGLSLSSMIDDLDFPENTLLLSDLGVYMMTYKKEYIRDALRASDVLLAPSAGEGFHLPAIEAQACGTPVIGSNFTGQRETIISGWKIPTNNPMTGGLTWSHFGGYRFSPSENAIIDALQIALDYSKGANLESKTAIARSVKFYEWSNVYPLWENALQYFYNVSKGIL